jgi:hypothetical protein
MKKIVLLFFVGLGLSGFAFSESHEFMSIGPALGVNLAKVENTELSITGVGLNLNIFRFWGGTVGLYGNIGVGLPFSYKIDGYEESTDEIFTADIAMGPGFFITFSENMDLKIGVGLHFPVIFVPSGSIIGFGIGSTVALHYKLSSAFFVDVGSNFAFDFTGWGDAFSTSLKYSAFEIRPYIGIGFTRDK